MPPSLFHSRKYSGGLLFVRSSLVIQLMWSSRVVVCCHARGRRYQHEDGVPDGTPAISVARGDYGHSPWRRGAGRWADRPGLQRAGEGGRPLAWTGGSGVRRHPIAGVGPLAPPRTKPTSFPSGRLDLRPGSGDPAAPGAVAWHRAAVPGSVEPAPPVLQQRLNLPEQR